MAKELLKIKNLQAAVDGKVILKNLDITINAGETHVLMGQNGAGKSTLGGVIMGNPAFSVEDGNIWFEGENITSESPDKRARRGIFLSFQNPEEIPGVSLESFLRVAKGAVTGEMPRILSFRKEIAGNMEKLELADSYAGRELNVGFSGGEKKKSEILQMLTLNPKLAILDETDSGLDVDAVRVVADGVRRFRDDDNALLIITHGARLVENIQVDKVHVLAEGRIVKTGGAGLMRLITEKGFGALREVGTL
jgi:Fe-S cluster assembly ATP-binding protein